MDRDSFLEEEDVETRRLEKEVFELKSSPKHQVQSQVIHQTKKEGEIANHTQKPQKRVRKMKFKH